MAGIRIGAATLPFGRLIGVRRPATTLGAVRDFGGQFALESEALAAASASEARDDDAPAPSRVHLLSLRNDPFVSTLLAAAILRREQEKLEVKIGRSLTEGEVYLVHFLGPAGAGKFLSALQQNPGAAAAQEASARISARRLRADDAGSAAAGAAAAGAAARGP